MSDISGKSIILLKQCLFSIMEQIQLSNISFEGNNNVYLIDDNDTTILIDTGEGTEKTLSRLHEKLMNHGVAVSDIDYIFLTHWHADHTGLAGYLQAESDAIVYAHAADVPLIEQDSDAWQEMEQLQDRYLQEWGMPERKQEELNRFLDENDVKGDAAEVRPIQDGDVFKFDSIELHTVHVSGHAAGLCLFELNGSRNEVIAGDALLPTYTPNVGGADLRVDEPLRKYLNALKYMTRADYTHVWPGHRDRISNPTERANEIIEHHRERALKVLNVLDEHGPCDAWSVSDHLFGSLEKIHILHGPGEAYAHLDHLERTGGVLRQGTKYELSDRAQQLLSEDRIEAIDKFLD